MFYHYTIKYRNGNKLSGYAMSDKSEAAIKKGIAKKFFGDFTVELKKYGTKWPRINSDYIMSI